MNRPFWAQLVREGEGTTVRRVVTSPAFAAEDEVWAWVRVSRLAGDVISVWRRQTKVGSSAFHDVPLTARDPMTERTADYTADLARALNEVREACRIRGSARTSGPVRRTLAQQGVEARARLADAGDRHRGGTRVPVPEYDPAEYDGTEPF